jgi:hypothetical protein
VRSKMKTVGTKPTRNLLTAVPELHKNWQPSVTGTATHPAGTPATEFDPPPLTECEENHLVAVDPLRKLAGRRPSRFRPARGAALR